MYVSLSLLESENTSLRLTDINDKMQMEQLLEHNNHLHRIDLEHLNSGVYFLTLQADDFVKTVRIVKQ